MYNRHDFKQHHGRTVYSTNEEVSRWQIRLTHSSAIIDSGKMDETRRQRLDALKFTWKVRGAGVAVAVSIYC
jgi:hypothetical protein